ncbi:MAG TPA: hypothetical protein VK845_00430, partial [Gemmatimonadales bacterium]|nr:hypothetical protein [Gemmatimonadales bacterium]
VLDRDQENVIALQALADIAERAARLDEAERWLTILLGIDQGNAAAREQLARVAAGAGPDVSAEPAWSSVDEDVELPDGEAPERIEAGYDDASDSVGPLEGLEVPRSFALEEDAGLSDGDSLERAEAGYDDASDSVGPLEGLELADSFDAEVAGEEVEELDIVGRGIELEPVEGPADLERLEPGDQTGVEEAEASPEETEPAEQESEWLRPSMPEAASSLHAWDVEGEESADEESTVLDDAVDDTAALAGPELITADVESGLAWEPESDLDVEEEEGEQEGDETPAAFAELDSLTGFEESLTEERIPEEERAGAAELPAFEETAPLDGYEMAWDEGLERTTEGVTDSAEPEPETVATETMAELYLSQGHRLEALGIYRTLLARQPDNLRLKEKVTRLEEEGKRPAASPVGGPSEFAATSRGGQSVSDFFHVLLASRPDSEPPADAERQPAESSAPTGEARASDLRGPSESGSVGEPTRPAHDRLLLSSVFGEDASPVPPAVRGTGGRGMAGTTGRFSFDAFFGGQRGESVQPPEVDAGGTRIEEEDLDQFQAWLQSLKG